VFTQLLLALVVQKELLDLMVLKVLIPLLHQAGQHTHLMVVALVERQTILIQPYQPEALRVVLLALVVVRLVLLLKHHSPHLPDTELLVVLKMTVMQEVMRVAAVAVRVVRPLEELPELDLQIVLLEHP
jgi:hypothetical protein